MKVVPFWLAVVFVLVLAGCAQTPPVPPADPLAYSLEAWTQLKGENGNHYKYQRSFVSYFGFGSITSFEVKDDVVISRVYEAFDENFNTTETWTEQGAEVGVHGDESGAEPPRTVEQLYEECRSDVLSKSRVENYVFLSFFDDVLLECVYIPKSCADDCAVGVSVELLSFAGKDNE